MLPNHLSFNSLCFHVFGCSFLVNQPLRELDVLLVSNHGKEVTGSDESQEWQEFGVTLLQKVRRCSEISQAT